MRTEQLIADLVRDAPPVQPLARPWRRAGMWVLGAAIYLVLLTVAMSPRDDLSLRLSDPLFMLEQAAALLTGVTAAAAAFVTVVPGYRRSVILAPLAFCALWIALVAAGALRDTRAAGVVLDGDWRCVTTVLAGAALPTLLMARMIRRGAPLRPRATAGLAALAALGLGNLGACLSIRTAPT